MAKKGQTCNTCNGNCCYNRVCIDVSHIFPDIAQTYNAKESIMSMSQQGLRKMGAKIWYIEPGEPCSALDENNRCTIYKDRPRLCRSWWCGGKYWQPRNAGVVQW